MIDWAKLKPYDSTVHRSFEEFCYRIADLLYGDRGTLTSIDDSGGGDGVEFYLTLPNGEQWGWQAKWYYPQPRLDTSRRTKVTNSLQRACAQHPQMTRWFLCTPTDLTTGNKSQKGQKETQGEQEWFTSTLASTIPAGHPAQIEHWGESFFISHLADPRFVGTRLYFFGELELGLDWFTRQFEGALATVHGKYISGLHIATDIDAHLHAILGDRTFATRIEERLAQLDELIADVGNARTQLYQDHRLTSASGSEIITRLCEQLDQIVSTSCEVRSRLQSAHDLMCAGDIAGARSLSWDDLWSQMQTHYDAFRADCASLHQEEDSLNRTVQASRSKAGQLFDAVWVWPTLLKDLMMSELHILGGAGFGKTHFACHICEARLNESLPALLILGSRFTSTGSLTDQLRSILDIPPTYSIGDFLQALSTAARVYRTRLPVVIDGLNEATENGAFSRVWQRDLATFASDIARSTNLVLVTTTRDAYSTWIWPDGPPTPSLQARGFGTGEVEAAIARYFTAYKIVADLTAAPLEQFEHPIYLRIFCESQNAEHHESVYVYVGEQTLFDVFASYLVQCNQRLTNRLRHRSTAPIVQHALSGIAQALWHQGVRRLPLDQAIQLIDERSRAAINDWTTSRTHALEAEGLLVCRDLCRDLLGSNEVLSVTYDLLAGYLIAEYLITAASSDVAAYLTQPDLVAALFGEDITRRHPLADDIGRCLAALLPMRTGLYMHAIVPGCIPFDLSVRAFFEMKPQAIDQSCVDLVARLFTVESNRRRLLSLASTTVGHLAHPLNMDFWHNCLRALSMPERDSSWTEHVRGYASRMENDVLRFEQLCRDTVQIDMHTQKRLRLIARHTMWLLTSTVRRLRDMATRALYWYGRHWPTEMLTLLADGLYINDPYVPERLLSVAYGIAMAWRDGPEPTDDTGQPVLPQLGQLLYDSFFAPGAPSATTHILMADYARYSIEIALYRYPDFLTTEQRQHITLPTARTAQRPWGHLPEDPASGLDPLQMDFARYTIGRLDQGRTGTTVLVEQVRWRIADLGYTTNRFGTIDRDIQEMSWTYQQGDPQKIERYGKKYGWVAFYELAGLRRSQGLLDHERYSVGRISDVDIDPSFPDPTQQHAIVSPTIDTTDGLSLPEWIKQGPELDVRPSLIVEDLLGEDGPWVLLAADINQEDAVSGRSRWSTVRSLVVRGADVNALHEALTSEAVMSHDVQDIPTDYYTYAGEIPWCVTYPLNRWSTIVPINREEHDIPSTQQASSISHTDDAPLEHDELVALLMEASDDARMTGRDLVAVLQERGVHVNPTDLGIESATSQSVVARDTQAGIDVLSPVRANVWESDRSSIQPSRSIVTPAREIADLHGLTSRPQTFDLYDPTGRRASIRIESGIPWHAHQTATYLRKDLLDAFLADHKAELVWQVGGERRMMTSGTMLLGEEDAAVGPVSFSNVRTYGEQGTGVSGDRQEQSHEATTSTSTTTRLRAKRHRVRG